MFELNPAGLNWPRAVLILDVLLVPLVLFWAIGYEQYLLSAVFGLLFAAAIDPGGGYGQRAVRIVLFAAAGAGVTALGFAMAGTVAIAWGASLSHGYWMAIACIIALRPGLDQSTLYAVQRLAGALIGAGAAMLLLLIPAHVHGLRLLATIHGLEVVALVLLVHAVATRFCNYAVYCAAIAAAVLTLLDLPRPTNYGAEGYRVLWTLCGVAIGVVVTFLADLLGKRNAGQAHDNKAGNQSDDGRGVPRPRDPAGQRDQVRQRAADGG